MKENRGRLILPSPTVQQRTLSLGGQKLYRCRNQVHSNSPPPGKMSAVGIYQQPPLSVTQSRWHFFAGA